jgi:hypothetical protein
MSKAQHTPEPWIVSKYAGVFQVRDSSDRIVADAGYGLSTGADEANARRIVACVNALEGLNDDALIGGWSFRGSEAYSKGLEQQRDELLEALAEFLAAADNSVSPESDDDIAAMLRYADAEKDARAVIAKYRNPGNTACITTGE